MAITVVPWSEKTIVTTADPAVVRVMLLNLGEADPANQNATILLSDLATALGLCNTFTADNTATTTLQDDRLIDKVVGDIRALFIGGTEVVSLGKVSSLDGTTGTITLADDFGGATAIITLA